MAEKPDLPGGLERAKPEDARDLSDLAHSAYEIYIPIINSIPLPMSADYSAFIRDHEVWLIRNEGRLAASLVLIWHDDHLLIESIAVSPDHQGKGLGRIMLEWALHRAQVEHVPEARLYTNALMTRNRKWYGRAGFRETHEEDRGGKHIVHMRYQL